MRYFIITAIVAVAVARAKDKAKNNLINPEHSKKPNENQRRTQKRADQVKRRLDRQSLHLDAA